MSRTIVVLVKCDECHKSFDESEIHVVLFQWNRNKPVNLDLCTQCKDESTAMFQTWLKEGRQVASATKKPAKASVTDDSTCPKCQKKLSHPSGLLIHMGRVHKEGKS